MTILSLVHILLWCFYGAKVQIIIDKSKQNDRFLSILKEYNISLTNPDIENKYLTFATAYYNALLGLFLRTNGYLMILINLVSYFYLIFIKINDFR